MPSSEIHVSFVTNCSPLWPVLKSASSAIDRPSVTSDPASAAVRAVRPGNSEPTKTEAAGSQSRIERCMPSARLDQEVEADRGQAEQHERCVDPQEPGLHGA